MTIKLIKSSDIWYFSKGFFIEHTIALYYPAINSLTVLNLRHLPSIIKIIHRETIIENISLDLHILAKKGRVLND